MFKKILFGIATILAIWACVLCTMKLAQAETFEEPWHAVGNAISYCSGVGFQYNLMSKYHEAGAQIMLVTPDRDIRPYFSAYQKYTCDVEFLRTGRLHGESTYYITMIWQFFTPEAQKAWGELVIDDTAHFCRNIKETDMFGYVKIIYHDDNADIIDCEEYTES